MAVQSNFNKIVLLQDFAKYFNRRIFYYATLNDYINEANNNYTREDINFNDNDGIRTTLEALEYVEDSVGNLSKEFDMESIDYLLVVDPSDDEIVSRWYVVDIVRTRNGLYNLKLKRDTVAEVISDNDFLVNSPVYVEKGHLQNSDPFIVNSENLSFNQIKKGESLIRDSNIGGWIVGYMANDASGHVQTYIRSKAPSEYYTMTQISTDTGIPESVLNSLDTTPVYFNALDENNHRTHLGMEIRSRNINGVFTDADIDYNGIYLENLSGRNDTRAGKDLLYFDGISLSYSAALVYQYWRNYQIGFEDDLPSYRSNILSLIENKIGQKFFFEENYDKLINYNGKILVKGGVYYEISFVNESSVGNVGAYEIPFGQNAYLDNITRDVVTFYRSQGLSVVLNEGTGVYWLNVNARYIKMVLTPLPYQGYELNIPSSHNILQDAPYSMFAIPLNGLGFIESDDPDTIHPMGVKDLNALSVASAIATALGTGEGGKIYDLQILPYCPCPEMILAYSDEPSKVYLGMLSEGKDFSRITYDDGDGDVTDGIIFFPVRSSFSLTVSKQITAEFSPKIESQVAFYRLCSPNYSGVFEFNLARNGNVDYFLVDCTYKPFNPFIRVTPQFGFLYGENFKDGRGLICGGDFSLAIIQDRWIQYELNNKNYAAIFARDIQNMEFKHGQEAFLEPIKAAAGTIGAGAAGAVAGAKVGGGYGAIAGGVAGTGLGLAGGAIDIAMGKARRAEEKDYAIDRFNLQLGNIKALPQSLSKTSVLTVISKIFPFLEYYKCTDEEVAALEKKIQYDGMTVGRIGKVADFMGGNDNQYYFKGQLIRANLFGRDEHFYNDLYEEIAKGVYI